MKVCLINPPSPFLINQRAIPPLGILYIAGYLRATGISVEILDLTGNSVVENSDSWPDMDLYGITATTPQYPLAKSIKAILKQRFGSSSDILIGGPHATSCSTLCQLDGFDGVVCGEGERAMFGRAAGIFSWHILRQFQIEDLDSIPMPAWDLIDIKSYGYEFGCGPAASIITSRGCSWGRCAFCSSVFEKVRYHSSKRVLKEIERLVDFGFSTFTFLDDAFTGNVKRLEEILQLIKPLHVKWRCYSRAGISKQLLEKMYDAGCAEIGFGAESGSQEILDTVYKGTKVETNTRFVKDCQEVGIPVQAFLMVGLPGETYRTIQQTREWFFNSRPNKFGLNIFVPYPGSAVWENPRVYKVRLRDLPWEKMCVKGLSPDDIVSSVATEELDFSDIEAAYRELMHDFSKAAGFFPGETNG